MRTLSTQSEIRDLAEDRLLYSNKHGSRSPVWTPWMFGLWCIFFVSNQFPLLVLLSLLVLYPNCTRVRTISRFVKGTDLGDRIDYVPASGKQSLVGREAADGRENGFQKWGSEPDHPETDPKPANAALLTKSDLPLHVPGVHRIVHK